VTDAASLLAEVQELEHDIAMWSADQKAAAAVRTKEAADFSATHTDYSESLD